MPQSYWSTITRLEPVVGKTRSGKPVRTIETDTGKRVSLLGTWDLLNKLAPGMNIQHSKPGEPMGGRQYATLEFIESPATPQQGPQVHRPGYTWEPPDSYQREKQLHQPAPKPPEPQILGGLPQAQGVPTWEEYKRVFEAAHRLAYQYEPDIPCDPKTNDQFINNATARVALIQTILVTYREGQVQAPKDDGVHHHGGLPYPNKESEIPGADAPMPDDDDIKWGRAS